MRLDPGCIIGRFTIQDLIGTGSRSIVYRAYDAETGEIIALKLLSRALAFNAYARDCLRRELDSLMALKHPQIVPIYARGQYREQIYIASRYMVGGNLAMRLDQNAPLSLSAARLLFLTLAPALDAAHAAHISHGNLTPTNILFDADDAPYIADFGLEQGMVSNSAFTRHNAQRQTVYMSPEQVRGEPGNHRSDLYILGLLLYQIITGNFPFAARSPQEMGDMHQSAPIPLLHNELDAFFHTALAKQATQRFATASAFAEAIPTHITQSRRRWWQRLF